MLEQACTNVHKNRASHVHFNKNNNWSANVLTEKEVQSGLSRKVKGDKQHVCLFPWWVCVQIGAEISMCAVANSKWVSNYQRGNSHCSCTRSTSLEGPVERRCTRPRCVHAGRHVCTKSQPLVRHHWWCSPSAPPERAGNEPRWMSEGPGWSCSVGQKDK